MMFGKDIGGAKVELLQKDMLQAAEIMKDHGYEVPAEIIEQGGNFVHQLRNHTDNRIVGIGL